MYTVLLLGGYGYFGSAIARRLAGDTNLRLIIAGRNMGRARNFAHSVGAANVAAREMDARAPDLAQHLAALEVDAVVHAAGPFQGQDYHVAQACIAAGCHYIDLADARAFVCGIGVLDAAARSRGVLVASGASSVPALSSAVVDHFLQEFSELRAVRHGISSSARTPGRATVEGVLGYCGKTFTRLESGAWREVVGWQDLRVHSYPRPVGLRLLANCDVPDLELFPARYPTLHTVRFQAGLGLAAAHLATWAMSGAVRAGAIADLARFSAALRGMSGALECLGSDASAMHVEMEGTGRDGRPLTRTWVLVAEQGHGPQIPCGPALALVRALAAGRAAQRGAMPCMGLISLRECLDALNGLALRQFMT